ncbi:NAD+ synthase [Caldicoprobacter faecalis]|uniref:Glutamine-dependent NAD(+) synthetase n=1 Tax=Caldicoprobacter faecalis TaxID=937334 RepID=A0A1I5Y4K2_9FIRM|nr:NAD+ synthase [Caldicoprobacter faecalis]SFQ38887.1 NAD+ synthase (glutamine-hydrolysing) [Caldicoprobacter faecalis]
MRIALVQLNPVVGDLKGNASKIIEFIKSARSLNCDLVVFPELSLIGYPPQGLLKLKDFTRDCQAALRQVVEHTDGIGVLLGTALQDDKKGLYSAALLIENRQVVGYTAKRKLKVLGAFDEACYFEPFCGTDSLAFREYKLAVTVGDDVWGDAEYRGVDLIINISASPYCYGQFKWHNDILVRVAKKIGAPLVYVNQVGGNDDLVFAGTSRVFDEKGQCMVQAQPFVEEMVVFDLGGVHCPLPCLQEDISWLYKALVLGVRDYFSKNGFKKAVLGLSGGVDSALVACIMADALGRENVLGVYMPSRYSSEHSRQDAQTLAENLGIQYRVIPIEDIFKEYLKVFNGSPSPVGDVAEENVQARIRGNLLMFIANREGRVLVSTSNRSETSVGYTTIYGDMCGGLAPIADIPKTVVYDVCSYVNRDQEVIPHNTLIKPPSAELRPNQKDQDSLPPYDVLDAVLSMYIDEGLSADEIVARGYDRLVVCNILNMVQRSEYKRRQAPLAIRVFSPIEKAGRNPVVHGYRWE